MGKYVVDWQRMHFYNVLRDYISRGNSTGVVRFEDLFYVMNTSTTNKVTKSSVRSFIEMLEVAGILSVDNRDRLGEIVEDSEIYLNVPELPSLSDVVDKANEKARRRALARAIVPFIGMLSILVNEEKKTFSYPNTEAIRWALSEGLIKKVGVGERREGIYEIDKEKLSPYISLLKLKEVNYDLFESYWRLLSGEEIGESELEALSRYGLTGRTVDEIILEA
jgi:hypothetical protein